MIDILKDISCILYVILEIPCDMHVHSSKLILERGAAKSKLLLQDNTKIEALMKFPHYVIPKTLIFSVHFTLYRTLLNW